MRSYVLQGGGSDESEVKRLVELLREYDEAGQIHSSNSSVGLSTLPTEFVLNSIHWQRVLWKVFDQVVASAREVCPLKSVTVTNSSVRTSCEGWDHATTQIYFSQVQLPKTIDFAPRESRLTSLTLDGCNLKPGVATSLSCYLVNPDCLLEVLDLSGTFMGDSVVSVLAVPGLSLNTSLLKLNLAECNLLDQQATALVQALSMPIAIDENDQARGRSGKRLQELDLSFNKCGSASASALARLLQLHPLDNNEEPNQSISLPLTHVSIAFQAHGHGKINLTSMLSTLSSNQQLQELEVVGNGVVDDHLIPCISTMVLENHFNTTLLLLDLSLNKLSDEGIGTLSDNLNRFPRLRCLGLDDLPLVTSVGWERLAHNVVKFCQNQSLDLEEVQTTDLEFMKSKVYRDMAYHLDLNWGGWGRLQKRAPIPRSLWPCIWARSNHPTRYGMVSRTPVVADIIFAHLVEQGPLMF